MFCLGFECYSASTYIRAVIQHKKKQILISPGQLFKHVTDKLSTCLVQELILIFNFKILVKFGVAATWYVNIYQPITGLFMLSTFWTKY